MKLLRILTTLPALIAGLWPLKSAGQATEAETFVQRLDALGYFNYAAPENREALMKNMADNFDPHSELPTISMTIQVRPWISGITIAMVKPCTNRAA